MNNKLPKWTYSIMSIVGVIVVAFIVFYKSQTSVLTNVMSEQNKAVLVVMSTNGVLGEQRTTKYPMPDMDTCRECMYRSMSYGENKSGVTLFCVPYSESEK